MTPPTDTSAGNVNPEHTRRLPMTPRLVGGETIGSFLARLAHDNSLSTKTLIRQLAPALSRRQITPATDTASTWQPADLTRLAAKSGHPLSRLERAVPAIADVLAARKPTASGNVTKACDHCVARKGITTAVYRRARPHEHLCHRHQRWFRNTGIHLADAPEILAAQRRLDNLARRHDDTAVAQALKDAHRVTAAWLVKAWHPALHLGWDHRINTLLGPPPHPPGAQASTLAATVHPEVVAIANALLSTATGRDPQRALLTLTIELELPDRRVPGERDPLRRIVMQYTHGAHRG